MYLAYSNFHDHINLLKRQKLKLMYKAANVNGKSWSVTKFSALKVEGFNWEMNRENLTV